MANKRVGTVDEQIDEMRAELLLYGFAAAKETARLRGLRRGTMPCPLCQQLLAFSTAETNGHFSARCKTKDCINAME